MKTDKLAGKLTRRGPLTWAAFGVVLVLVPFVLGDGYELGVATLILIFGAAACALDLVVGRIGLASIAHGALMTIGAYALALLTIESGWSYWLAFLASVVVTAVTGLVLSILTIRLRGHYFAVCSLAFSGAIVIVLTEWESITRGSLGVYGIPRAPDLEFAGELGELGSEVGQYYLSAALLVVILVLVAAWMRSPWGRALRVIKRDEVLAQAIGIDIVREKTKTMMVSAGIIGAVGAVYAGYVSYISPVDAAITPGFNLIVYVMLGGAATLGGPVLGAAFILVLTELVRGAELWANLIFSVILLLVLLFFRDGAIGAIAKLLNRARATRKRAAPPPDVSSRTDDERDDYALSELAARSAAATIDGPVLAATGLTKRFGGLVAVDDTTVLVDAGEIVGVIGPNGAGKSTLFGMIAGTIRATKGSIECFGKEISKERPYKRIRHGIARTFQTNRVLDDQTVYENMLAAEHSNFSTNLATALVRPGRRTGGPSDPDRWLGGLLRLLNLDEQVHVPAAELSIEQARLLAIGMALVTQPRILALDEPFAGLRDEETERLGDLLLKLRDAGVSILLIEHKMSVIQRLCNRCYVLDHGQQIAEGPPASILENEDVIHAYLGTADAPTG